MTDTTDPNQSGSDSNSNAGDQGAVQNKEQRIIGAVKFVLTNIVKETATAPGMKHPLSDQTLMDIRHCLVLISEREKEFAEQGLADNSKRPQTPADRATQQTRDQFVPISDITRKKT